MEKKPLKECPVCGEALRVRVLQCPSCRVRIEGDFEPPRSRLLSLPDKDLEFVELFVRVRGNLREMEKALGVSYPTVRGMLDALNRRLGFPSRPSIDPRQRMEVLAQLDRGEISAERAAEILEGGAAEDTESERSKSNE